MSPSRILDSSNDKGKPSDKDTDSDKGKNKDADTRAKLVVKLPKGAKLYVDDKAIDTKADQKTFRTPELRDGQKYYYEVRAEVVRNGKTVTETKRIIVSAGRTSRADFTTMGSSRDSGVASAD